MWYFFHAIVEILVHTGLSIALPGTKEFCLVRKIFPNTGQLSVVVEGHEGTWPRQREAVVEWWRRGLSGSGWQAAPEGKWVGGGLVGVVYVIGITVMWRNWSGSVVGSLG
jgi:hypothetical protein